MRHHKGSKICARRHGGGGAKGRNRRRQAAAQERAAETRVRQESRRLCREGAGR